ncbi:helicase HerA-like domain-containing protein [Pontibaca methylaminivorans]|uniref:helicase HerA-like domain-containing protein n=1 Tax=Pontibaca methylaminivorans TaxID=515897 RepID=UPI002FD89AF3
MSGAIFIGGGGPDHDEAQELALRYANRHGLIAGATGTGKTVTLQILAEGFSEAGVPVFLSDAKGDIGGLALPGSETAKQHAAFVDRARQIGLDGYGYRGCPVTFWDLFGEAGHPVRTTPADMGPLLISRLLDLSEAQEGVVNIAFRLADEEGLALLDFKDLQALLLWIGENRAELSARYGNVSSASVSAIQRRLLVLENQGGAQFFGEPALDLADLMRCDGDGRGMVNILAADRLLQSPALYSTFLLWLMSELFESLPEVGDPDKPRLVLFFDEAHLLFDGAPKVLVNKIEQVARLIRSKGVGIYFVTQNPADIPESVLGQLGNRLQHALRAFTANDRAKLVQAARTYRDNPRFSTEEAIRELGVGEAVTSMLGEKGVPGTLIRPPSSSFGPIGADERSRIMAQSPMGEKYDRAVDRESAYELLEARARVAADAAGAAGQDDRLNDRPGGQAAVRRGGGGRPYGGRHSTGAAGGIGEALARSVVHELGGASGRRLVRGVLGSLFKGRR